MSIADLNPAVLGLSDGQPFAPVDGWLVHGDENPPVFVAATEALRCTATGSGTASAVHRSYSWDGPTGDWTVHMVIEVLAKDLTGGSDMMGYGFFPAVNADLYGGIEVLEGFTGHRVSTGAKTLLTFTSDGDVYVNGADAGFTATSSDLSARLGAFTAGLDMLIYRFIIDGEISASLEADMADLVDAYDIPAQPQQVGLDLDPTLLGLSDGQRFQPNSAWVPDPRTNAAIFETATGALRCVPDFVNGSGSIIRRDSSWSPSGPDWTVHLVVEVLTPPGSPTPIAMGGWGTLLASPEGVWIDDPTQILTDGSLAVITCTSDAKVYVNGTDSGFINSNANSLAGAQFGTLHPGYEVRLYRVILVEDIKPTLQADMNALVTRYLGGGGGDTIELSDAEVTIGISASAALLAYSLGSPDDPTIIPDPPPLTPGGSVEPPPDPEPMPPPPGAPLVQRVSEIMPAPALDPETGLPSMWTPSSVIQESIGRPQIIIEGVDVTYLRDVPTPMPEYTRAEPFGSQNATITLPQVHAFDDLGVGELAWCREGANVHVRFGSMRLFTGVVTGIRTSEPGGTLSLACLGIMYASDTKLKKPRFVTQPVDIGQYVAQQLNDIPDRRYKRVAPVTLGIKTSVLGGWEPVIADVQQKLATALTKDGQITVKCAHDQPVIEAKDTDTISWSFRYGQRGIDCDLSRDTTQGFNVIYGEGVGEDGGRWRNAMYPNWTPDDTPPYPGGSGAGISVGWTDAQTTPQGGVSRWQEKVGQPATGRFSQADRQAAIRLQKRAGIQVDGFVGPQTWAATWQTGSNTGTLDGALIAPLAAAPEVMPQLYGADGADLGPNPAFDPGVLRVEQYVNFGPGVSKSEGIRAAEHILAREADPGWAGTIRFSIDPNEGSRFLRVLEGTNGLIRGYRGQDLKVHVAAVQCDGETVTATVDTRARDYPTLASLLSREREAIDPARSYRRRQTRSGDVSERGTWDSESPGGIVPAHATFGGLWNVLRIPFAQYGSIVRTDAHASTSAFSLAVFDRPITHQQLMQIVGNPLTADANPWSEKAEALAEAGLLQAWGWAKQPCGYWPHSYSTPDGEDQAPVTGRLLDDASWTFASERPPWLWVAVITSQASRFSARFYPGVTD